MLKQQTAKPTNPEASTNGLLPADAAALEKVLGDLDPLLSRLFLFGGREAGEIASVAAKIKDRLRPPTPEELLTEARRLLAMGVPLIESRRRASEEHERSRAAVAAASMAARDKMHEQQAARAEQICQRKDEQARANAEAVSARLAVDEVIL
jgi:hypothetical protein